MKKTVVLSISKSKGLFRQAYKQQECGNLSLLTVMNSSRAIAKLKKTFYNADIIVAHQNENERVLANKCKIYGDISFKTVLPVLNKICRQVAAKYNLDIPLGEVYIAASPPIACAMVACLYSISRIFTVVSCESPLTNMYDELYFKHGTIIRHLPDFNNSITEDSIIIRCSEDELPLWAKIPVIDFSEKVSGSNLTVIPKEIFVYDENISNVNKFWGGQCGLGLYELAGEIPTEKAEVNINKKADKIFLLDTNRI